MLGTKRLLELQKQWQINGVNMASLIYTEAFLNRQDAEIKRQEFLDENMDLGLELIEDEIKFINLHYVVRILFSDRQQEFDL